MANHAGTPSGPRKPQPTKPPARKPWVPNPPPVPKAALLVKKPKPAPAPPKVKPLPPCARRALDGETLHLFQVRENGGQTRLAVLPVGNGKRLFSVQHLVTRPDGSRAPFGWVNFSEEEARTLAQLLAMFLGGGAE